MKLDAAIIWRRVLAQPPCPPWKTAVREGCVPLESFASRQGGVGGGAICETMLGPRTSSAARGSDTKENCSLTSVIDCDECHEGRSPA